MDYPIRVLCVFSTLDRGGAESMCMNLYRKIDRSKVQFDFVKHTPNKGSYEDEITSLGGYIYIAPEYRVNNHFFYCGWWERHFRNHPEHLIIHGHYFTISAVYFKVAKKFERITVGHIHATRVDSKLKSLYVKAIKYYADYKLACSTEAGKWVYNSYSFKVFPNAIDLDLFRYSQPIRQEMRARLGLSDELTLGTVANMSRVKNPMGLIDIFLEIYRIVPKTKLIWVGEGNLRKAIEDRIKLESIEEQIIMLGAREDVPNVLQAMDVFLLPSFNEGLPVSVIEAQASGLPCYLSDAITKDADITGMCCFLPIDQPESWANKILNSNNVRIDTSRLIKASGYDITTTVELLQSFYLELIAD